MPIRGDRLRWPPRPGKKYSEAAGANGTKRSLATDEKQAGSQPPLRQPNERDESADRQASKPRNVIQQAHDDIETGKEDTDCRNRTSEVLGRAPAERQPITRQKSGNKG